MADKKFLDEDGVSQFAEETKKYVDKHADNSDIHVTAADKTMWNGKQDALTSQQLANIADVVNKANVSDLSAVATSGSYNDLTDKPTIPTVNNATLTIQKNGTTVETFTANASSNVTADIVVPTKTSELTNDSGFLTTHNPVDNALSSTSTNAVQNKVVNTALNAKADVSDLSNYLPLSGGTVTGRLNLNNEIRYIDTTYDWSDPSLNVWCGSGHTIWSDRTGTRRIHTLVGANGGVWRKVCFINENTYFNVNSNRNIDFYGVTFKFNNKNVDVVEELGDGYIRYSSGLQICTGTTSSITLSPDEAKIVSATFPKSFSSAPNVISCSANPHIIAATWVISKTGCEVYLKSTSPGTSTHYGRYIAFGRWK